MHAGFLDEWSATAVTRPVATRDHLGCHVLSPTRLAPMSAIQSRIYEASAVRTAPDSLACVQKSPHLSAVTIISASASYLVSYTAGNALHPVTDCNI